MVDVSRTILTTSWLLKYMYSTPAPQRQSHLYCLKRGLDPLKTDYILFRPRVFEMPLYCYRRITCGYEDSNSWPAGVER